MQHSRLVLLAFCLLGSASLKNPSKSASAESGLGKSKMTAISCAKGKDQFCASCRNGFCHTCYASLNINGICKAIPTPIESCAQYTSDGSCFLCRLGYYLSRGVCLKSQLKNCFMNLKSDTSKCGVCDGYVLRSDGECDAETKCTKPNCRSCVVEDDKEICLWCVDGYVLARDEDYKCVEAVSSLENCFGQNAEGKCVTCNFGYYIDPTLHGESAKCLKSPKYDHQAIVGGLIRLGLVTLLIK